MICVVITFEKALQMVYFIVSDDENFTVSLFIWQVEEDGGAGRSDAGGDAVAVQMAAVQV
jgi:hypothetical protein